MDVSNTSPGSYVGWIWIGCGIATAAIIYFLRGKPRLHFYTVVTAAAIWALVLFVITPPFWKPEFWHSLADACLIAAILAATVDQYVKERVLHEVTSDVSKYLIGYRLPEQLQDRLRSIMQTIWIRRTFEVRIRLREIEGGETELDVSLNYQVQNITSETHEYTEEVTFSKFERFEVVELRCDSPGKTYHLTGEQIKTNLGSGKIRHQGDAVKVPPASESPDDFRFSSRYRVKHPGSSKETITFTKPTIGAVVEMTDCPATYVFHLSPTPDSVTHHRWSYNRLFLPGEQITIQWEIEAQAPATRFIQKPEVAT